MTDKITYFAILGASATVDRPQGLLRRLEHDDGPEDEGLHRDMSWRATSLIVEQENGSSDEELVEVSHEQASRIVQYFRERFADPDERPFDPDLRA
jgi:hypothetical protein